MSDQTLLCMYNVYQKLSSVCIQAPWRMCMQSFQTLGGYLKDIFAQALLVFDALQLLLDHLLPRLVKLPEVCQGSDKPGCHGPVDLVHLQPLQT